MYGKYDVIPRTVRAGDSAEVAVDVNARLLIDAGGGTPGAPGGGVQSVQGVVGGQMVPVEVVDSNGVPLDYTIPAPVWQAPAVSAALTSVNSAATSATLLAASATRLTAAIVNTDANPLYIKYGATATTAIGGYTYVIPSNGTWDMPFRYVGIIDGIWGADGSGGASITVLATV